MISFPNAKINLGLNVVEKRSDGYHNLETVFYPVRLADALEFVESKEFSITVTGIVIDGNSEKNLVVRAYNLLKQDFNLPPVKIHLHKAIPFGAGLGGGSSDGAFMLKMLNSYFSLGLENSRLEVYASMLGADCPFFIQNKSAFAKGIGDILLPVNVDLNRFKIIVVKPPFLVPTSEAYKNIVPRNPVISPIDAIKLPVGEWKDVLKNDFEEPVFKLFPEIKQIKEQLYLAGATYASMSGSGSAVFALFPVLQAIPEIFPYNNYFIYR
jgi:4-diphosphocytidyl-2-C-methyl-D-erythritol kinase